MVVVGLGHFGLGHAARLARPNMVPSWYSYPRPHLTPREHAVASQDQDHGPPSAMMCLNDVCAPELRGSIKSQCVCGGVA